MGRWGTTLTSHGESGLHLGMSLIVGGSPSVQSAGMTLTEELPTGPPDQVPPGTTDEAPPESSEPPALRRSAKKHLIAGVCGGVAERFEVDVTIVRVAFVVAACLWGVGVVVYLALWALVPVGDDAGRNQALDTGELSTAPPWMSYVLLTAALFLGLVISTSWWGGPKWGGGLGLAWLVVLFAVVVVALRRPVRRPTIGRALLTVALIVLSLIILATGAFFGAVAMTGVPLTGGIGQRVVQPTTLAELHPLYRMAIGNLTVDLTHVPLGGGTRTVTASVAVGQLVVDVPPGVVVDVDAHSSIGKVVYGSSGPQAFSVPLTAFGPARPRLIIDAQVGIGQIELERGGS
jgi:phage shock protein PspC (stress-responsive transcriptional regulator)